MHLRTVPLPGVVQSLGSPGLQYKHLGSLQGTQISLTSVVLSGHSLLHSPLLNLRPGGHDSQLSLVTLHVLQLGEHGKHSLSVPSYVSSGHIVKQFPL